MSKKSKCMGEYGLWGFIILNVIYCWFWYAHYGGNSIQSDGTVYYSYFVKIFISHDFTNNGLIKFPIGTTILQLPFLLLAYGLSIILGKDLYGGYSPLFQVAVYAAAVFYFIAGISLLYKLLRKKYSQTACLITLLAISHGTMLIEYATRSCSFSHVYGFFICVAFFCYITYYEENVDVTSSPKKLALHLLLGFLLSLASIIRNTNIIIGMAYLFYNVDSLKSFINRLRKRIFRLSLVFQLLGFSIVYSIQLICWKIQTGEWIFYSYGEEKFLYVSNPQIINVLFSDAKGLFIYCPVLFVSIIGMIMFRKENREYCVAQWFIFAGITYFISAWWCWWLGGAYSERMYCDILCIFALPMAAFFDHLIKYFKTVIQRDALLPKIAVSLICLSIMFYILLNITWINGVHSGAINANMGSWHELKEHFYNYLVS